MGVFDRTKKYVIVYYEVAMCNGMLEAKRKASASEPSRLVYRNLPALSLPLRVTFLLYRSGSPSNLVGRSRLLLDY